MDVYVVCLYVSKIHSNTISAICVTPGFYPSRIPTTTVVTGIVVGP